MLYRKNKHCAIYSFIFKIDVQPEKCQVGIDGESKDGNGVRRNILSSVILNIKIFNHRHDAFKYWRREMYIDRRQSNFNLKWMKRKNDQFQNVVSTFDASTKEQGSYPFSQRTRHSHLRIWILILNTSNWFNTDSSGIKHDANFISNDVFSTRGSSCKEWIFFSLICTWCSCKNIYNYLYNSNTKRYIHIIYLKVTNVDLKMVI